MQIFGTSTGRITSRTCKQSPTDIILITFFHLLRPDSSPPTSSESSSATANDTRPNDGTTKAKSSASATKRETTLMLTALCFPAKSTLLNLRVIHPRIKMLIIWVLLSLKTLWALMSYLMTVQSESRRLTPIYIKVKFDWRIQLARFKEFPSTNCNSTQVLQTKSR